jgi:N-acetylglucosamine-6-sulfatase
MMSCAGHPWLKTPHLDRLAGGGVLFRNAFCTTSLCSPSRASILTGQYAHAHGVVDNATEIPRDRVLFPELLQQTGYRTAFFGKWHMGNESDSPRPGFDHWISFKGQGTYFDPELNVDGARLKARGYTTDLLTEEAVRFIRASRGSPFFLYLSHKAPHSFCEPAARHREWYGSDPIPYPPSMANTEASYSGKPDWVKRQRKSWHGVDAMYDSAVTFDNYYRDYCRTVMSLDDSVGRVMNGLEESGLLNDTLVLYMSDNGLQLGEHGLIDKRTMYEPSIRVPMIAHCPDLFGGRTSVDGMALNIDVAPTFLDAAGLEPAAGMHGESLLRLLNGAGPWRNQFLYEYFWQRGFPQTPTVTGLRTERYSYMRYHGVWDVNELYDIQSDPFQMCNLLGDVRVTTQSGSLFSQIKDDSLRTLVADIRSRMESILLSTGGRCEPTWGN